MNNRDQQLLEDAKEAGFTIINGLIYSPPACDRMEAFRALRIIWENRVINQRNSEIEQLNSELVEYRRSQNCLITTKR